MNTLKKGSIAVFIYPKDTALSKSERLKQAAALFAEANELVLSSDFSITYGVHGKPGFANQSLCFSISHSGDYWAVALDRGKIGLDLQQIRSCREEQIACRFFHPQEISYLKETSYRDFFRVWTAKESYVKYTGEGIGNQFSDFSVTSSTALLNEVSGAVLQQIDFQKDYYLAVCTEKSLPVFIFNCA